LTDYPSSDESFTLLHVAGWPVGDVPLFSPAGPAWLVTGADGENVIETRAATQAEAWQRAAEQARSLGMLGRAFPSRSAATGVV
jgi:hypothetical protein